MDELPMIFYDVIDGDATKDIPKCQTGISDRHAVIKEGIPIIHCAATRRAKAVTQQNELSLQQAAGYHVGS